MSNQQPPDLALPRDVQEQRKREQAEHTQVQNMLITFSANVLTALAPKMIACHKLSWHLQRADESDESYHYRLKEETDATARLAVQYAGSLLECLGILKQKKPGPVSNEELAS